MAKFKQVPQTFLYRKLLEFWGNRVQNYRGDCQDDDFFDIIRNYLDADFNEASEDKPRMNVLLFGPPGTGKTEFVKYLGKTLDRKVLVVKGSDLLSKWVGESEQNIASAFRRA